MGFIIVSGAWITECIRANIKIPALDHGTYSNLIKSVISPYLL